MRPTRREFLRILFVATEAAALTRAWPADLIPRVPSSPSVSGLRFLVVGDWGREGEPHQAGVAAQMAVTAREMAARFVISVGDNFYPGGVASIDDPQWQRSFEQVYAAPSLQIPWHVTLGNHDYLGRCAAQLAYAATSPRWKMPARSFVDSQSIDASTQADFFYLDTTPLMKNYRRDEKFRRELASESAAAQIAWFRGALAASRAPWKIVIGHHPIYSGGEHGDSPELIEALLPPMREHGVQAYFNGHDHDLQHLMAGDLNLFCSGAGSEFRNTSRTAHTRFAQASSGFTAVSLGADTMDVRMIDNHGATLYTATVPRILPSANKS